MITLRRAGPADALAVRDLTHAAYAKWVPVLGREPLTMRVDYADAVERHRIDLLLDDDRLVALIETEARELDVLIINLAVAPAHQGRGHGRRLLAQAERLALEAEHGTLRLYTNVLFAENVAFYMGHGFTVERQESFMGGALVHMIKRAGA